MLAISGIKYLILGLVFAQLRRRLSRCQRDVQSVANFIYNSAGVGDLFANWMNQLAQYWQANGNTSLWNLVTGLAPESISLILILRRVHPFSLLLSHIHRVLRDVRVCPLCQGLCLGVAGPRWT